MRRFILFFTAFVVCTAASQTIAASTGKTISTYTISTFKNDQIIGTRKVNEVELLSMAIGFTSEFKAQTSSYDLHLRVAKGMTAKERCFNLYTSRVALASVEAGVLDASANAERFIRNFITSIEEVNTQTQVVCEMR